MGSPREPTLATRRVNCTAATKGEQRLREIQSGCTDMPFDNKIVVERDGPTSRCRPTESQCETTNKQLAWQALC